MIRVALVSFGLAGTVAFGGVFVNTLLNRAAIEQTAETFLMRRAEHALGISVCTGTAASPGASMDRLMASLPKKTKELSVVRPQGLQEGIRGRAGSGGPTSAADRGREGGDSVTLGAPYPRLLAGLIREVRVFTACNFALFAFTTLLAAWPRRHLPHLVVPAAILAATTGSTAGVYLAVQDWFWTFMTGAYVGYWYLVFVGAVASLLADVAWNRARVTSLVLRPWWHWPV